MLVCVGLVSRWFLPNQTFQTWWLNNCENYRRPPQNSAWKTTYIPFLLKWQGRFPASTCANSWYPRYMVRDPAQATWSYQYWKWGESSTQKCRLGWDVLVACPFFSSIISNWNIGGKKRLPFWGKVFRFDWGGDWPPNRAYSLFRMERCWCAESFEELGTWGMYNGSQLLLKPDSLIFFRSFEIRNNSKLIEMGEGWINIPKLGVQADLAFMQHCWVSSLVNWTRPRPMPGVTSTRHYF